MARNRRDLARTLSAVTSELLKEKGYICFVDVFMKLGYLSKSDYEHWRFRRVSSLERVLTVNLSRMHFIMKTVRRYSLNGHLKPSRSYWIPGSYAPTLSENRSAFLRPLKKKDFKEERVSKVGADDLDKSTTPESNKSLAR